MAHVDLLYKRVKEYLDSQDWKLRSADAAAERVLDEAGPGEVILMHDCYDSSVEAAFLIIDELEARGYEFVTVDEMIFP